MKLNKLNSNVEKKFVAESGISAITTTIPYIVADSVPKLGLLTALRFLEWVQTHPAGVVSLPAGKSPRYFIHYLHELLDGWEKPDIRELAEKYGLDVSRKPDLRGLHFVQMDEFYPIPSSQHNSSYKSVHDLYIKGFGMDEDKALFINCDEIPLYNGRSYRDIFPGYEIDLSLRYRQPKNDSEVAQQQSLFLIDDWCARYEDRIRALGGIGFFMDTVGSDGRIAFNIQGSSPYSHTRLTATNFATQADAAGDLGGFNVSSKRLVITIGLHTITANPDAVAVVFASGESNAEVIRQSLESDITASWPATVLQRLPNSRFFLTAGAASRLSDSMDRYYSAGNWNARKTSSAIIGLCKTINCYAHHLTLEDLQQDARCSQIPHLSLNTIQKVVDEVKVKLERGMQPYQNEIIYHTGPHHDDIMLGIMPLINRQLRSATNQVHFGVMTSGYNSVTNDFILEALEDTLACLNNDSIQMVHYDNFFTEGYLLKSDKDVSHYLDNVARKNQAEMRRGFCHRLMRNAVGIWRLQSIEEAKERFRTEISILKNSYPGQPNSPEIQRLKGSVREFEEELVWAYMGVPVRNVHHLRLGFYQSGMFSTTPNLERDVQPILNEFRHYKPTVISVALDPEGSGPDTHFKVLQAVAKAVEVWSKEENLSNLRILGYRNVWFKFNPADANVYVPVSLNAFSVLEKSFSASYLTQVKAEYPSPHFDGPFSELAESVWVQQLKDIQLVLGKDFFYLNDSPFVRATHGLIFLKEMNVKEFLKCASELRKANKL